MDKPDIVERLRADTRSAVHVSLSEEAANEIERLRIQVDRLKMTQRRLFDRAAAVLDDIDRQ